MSGLKLIPASAGGGWQRRYCEHPPSVMLGIKFQASAFWVGGCLHPLFYIALSGRVWARGSAGRAPRSHRGGRGFESLRVQFRRGVRNYPLWMISYSSLLSDVTFSQLDQWENPGISHYFLSDVTFPQSDQWEILPGIHAMGCEIAMLLL